MESSIGEATGLEIPFINLGTKQEVVRRLLHSLGKYPHICYLNPNGYTHGFSEILVAGKRSVALQDEDFFDKIDEIAKNSDHGLFGYLSYDLKNQVEQLKSDNPSHINFPNQSFFLPDVIIRFTETSFFIEGTFNPRILDQVLSGVSNIPLTKTPIHPKSNLTEDQYQEIFAQLKQHLQNGDIYEINFCLQFLAENAEISPVECYHALNAYSPTPFSAFYRHHDQFILCASPERFLLKQGAKVISQPIKGTAPRGLTPQEDHQIKADLLANKKERTENLMVVDLVRNDLARTAIPGTVKVEELFGVYTFPQVHQMISTISSEVAETTNVGAILKGTFPMGSMTGTPKIRAMKLIDRYEQYARGAFSGAIGYITPEGNFDFNVVIRSVLYDRALKRLCFPVGSAVTLDATAENEYRECMLKASAILESLSFEV